MTRRQRWLLARVSVWFGWHQGPPGACGHVLHRVAKAPCLFSPMACFNSSLESLMPASLSSKWEMALVVVGPIARHTHCRYYLATSIHTSPTLRVLIYQIKIKSQSLHHTAPSSDLYRWIFAFSVTHFPLAWLITRYSERFAPKTSITLNAIWLMVRHWCCFQLIL